ncbi:MAG: hypothetical protein C4B59_08570 [Candidatus Methanogaster sp.]|uniref:Uncharacterized protein n=1 Tax=Candidatus Methanogaster sp. TaxID=3386292 RepID=A0AC61L2R9_9EURY|nr:MAG: hypothetical protein C4B59_08570 [ANME-2 cluster archaeon]
MSNLTVAASEEAIQELCAVLRDNFTFSSSNSANLGPFSASYAAAAHLEGGTVDLRDDNTVRLKELDIKWDTLQAGVGFDIPEICVGGWCILWLPVVGCVIRLPKICIFSANPDIGIGINLSGIVTTEISVTASPVTRYRVDPARTSGMTYMDAEDANIPNKWQILIDPMTVDLDLFDISDIVGDLLENAVKSVIDNLLWFLPGWAKDLIWAILGPVIDLIRAILDLPDDIAEWFSDLIGRSLGLFNTITTVVADYFANKCPLYELEDPYPIMPASSGLIPVKIPVKDLSVRVNTREMIIESNLGV